MPLLSPLVGKYPISGLVKIEGVDVQLTEPTVFLVEGYRYQEIIDSTDFDSAYIALGSGE